MDKPKLKACPFCGKSDSVVLLDEGGRLHYVYCSGHKGGCGARTTLCEQEKTAVLHWNCRTQPDNKALTVAELLSINERTPLWIEHLESSCSLAAPGEWLIYEPCVPTRDNPYVRFAGRTLCAYYYENGWLAYRRPTEKGD